MKESATIVQKCRAASGRVGPLMDFELEKRVEELFQEAMTLPPEQQAAFLRQHCGNDQGLLDQVHALLEADREAGSFLNSPAMHLAGLPTQGPPSFVAVSSPTPVLPGQTVTHYQVLRQLGSGGMGVVYLAEDIKLGRRVAIKFLPGRVTSDESAYERMQREARSASALDHPNICSVYELGEHDGQPFIVMQLLEGTTLREWMKGDQKADRRARVAEAIDLVIQVARGLEAAHQKNIIHRDIKPENIFVTVRGEAKILDFGLAKVMEPWNEPEIAGGHTTAPYRDASPNLTNPGAMIGTAFYMSPEQIRGEKLDARSDLFSLGLVLFEVLAGRRAFKGATWAEVHDAVLHGTVEPVRKLNPAAPAGIETILRRSLYRNRDARYQSATAMLADLERCNRRPSQAARAGLRIGAACLLLSLAALWANLGGIREHMLRRPAQSEATATSPGRTGVAVLGFKNLSGKQDQAWVSTALTEMLDAQLSAGAQLRVVSGEDVSRMKSDLSLPAADSYSGATLKRIRNQLGSDIVVLGSYLDTGKDSGGRVRVDVRLQDARKGETIAVFSEDGNEDSLPELVTESGASLREKLGITGVSASEVSQAAAATNTNPEATRFYSEGLEKLRAYDGRAARDLLAKAVSADASFAMAHSAMAQAWSQLGYEKKAADEAKQAFDLSNGLSREQYLLIEGRYRESTHDFAAATEIYRTLRDFFPDNLDYAIRLVSAQMKAGHPKDALATVAQARTLPSPIRDSARIDYLEVAAQQATGSFPAMQKAAATAAAKARAQGARMLEAQALLAEAFAWDRLGDLNQAAKKALEGRDLAANSGNPDLLGVGFSHYAQIEYDKGNYHEAQRAFDQARRIFEEIGDGRLGGILVDLGNVFYSQGKLVEAKGYYEDALKIHQDAGVEPSTLAGDMGSVANVLDGLGDLEGATRMQSQALQSFRDGGDQRGESDTLVNLAIVLGERGHLTEAMEYYRQSSAIASKIGFKHGVAANLQGMAQILLYRDQLQESYEREQEAIAIRKEIGEQIGTAEAQVSLAMIALEQGKIEESLALVHTAAKQFDSSMPDDASQASATEAKSLLAQSKNADAAAAASKASAFAERVSYRVTRLTAALASAETDAANGKEAVAEKTLEGVLSEAVRDGYKEFEFEARLDLGKLELRTAKAAGRQRLLKLEEDATRQDFKLYARKAREAQRPVRLLHALLGIPHTLQLTDIEYLPNVIRGVSSDVSDH